MAHITVELRRSLEDDVIETLEPSNANVGGAIPALDDSRYPLLRLVDPYGDTAFSSYQMIGLIPELIQRYEETHDAVLADVIRLAECCRARRSYLVFIGD